MDKSVSQFLSEGRIRQYYIRSETSIWDQRNYIQGLIDMAHMLGAITEMEHWELHNLNHKLYVFMYDNDKNRSQNV
jgi:hypothetical protein